MEQREWWRRERDGGRDGDREREGAGGRGGGMEQGNGGDGENGGKVGGIGVNRIVQIFPEVPFALKYY